MSSLLNKTETKRYVLAVAQERAHEFSRVSQDFLDRIEARLRNNIRAEINSLPSKGKTIK